LLIWAIRKPPECWLVAAVNDYFQRDKPSGGKKKKSTKLRRTYRNAFSQRETEKGAIKRDQRIEESEK